MAGYINQQDFSFCKVLFIAESVEIQELSILLYTISLNIYEVSQQCLHELANKSKRFETCIIKFC